MSGRALHPLPVSPFGSCHDFRHFQGHFILAGSVLDKARILLKHKIAHPAHFFSGASGIMRRQNTIFQQKKFAVLFRRLRAGGWTPPVIL